MNIGEMVQLIITPVITLASLVAMWQKLSDKTDENRRRVEQLEESSREQQDRHAAIATGLATLASDIQWLKSTQPPHHKGNARSNDR